MSGIWNPQIVCTKKYKTKCKYKNITSPPQKLGYQSFASVSAHILASRKMCLTLTNRRAWGTRNQRWCYWEGKWFSTLLAERSWIAIWASVSTSRFFMSSMRAKLRPSQMAQSSAMVLELASIFLVIKSATPVGRSNCHGLRPASSWCRIVSN